MNQLLNVIVTEEDGMFVAQNPDTGVASQGRTIEESLENLKEAVSLYFEELGTPKSKFVHKHSFLTTINI